MITGLHGFTRGRSTVAAFASLVVVLLSTHAPLAAVTEHGHAHAATARTVDMAAYGIGRGATGQYIHHYP